LHIMKLTLEEFTTRFRPLANIINGDAPWNGMMYETFGEELAHVKALAQSEPNRIWTILDCDGQSVVTNGFQLVNRSGYIICMLPTVAGDLFEVLDDSPEERAKTDADTFRKLVETSRQHPGDGRGRDAIEHHMKAMASAAAMNPTEYIGYLTQHDSDLADRLEEWIRQEDAEARERRKTAPETSSTGAMSSGVVSQVVPAPNSQLQELINGLENLKGNAKLRGDEYDVGYIDAMLKHATAMLAPAAANSDAGSDSVHVNSSRTGFSPDWSRSLLSLFVQEQGLAGQFNRFEEVHANIGLATIKQYADLPPLSETERANHLVALRVAGVNIEPDGTGGFRYSSGDCEIFYSEFTYPTVDAAIHAAIDNWSIEMPEVPDENDSSRP
jgi:hypothetical protein